MLGNPRKLVVAAVALILPLLAAASQAAAGPRYAVLCPAPADTTEGFAAREFARYASAILGEQVRVVSDQQSAVSSQQETSDIRHPTSDIGNVILIGSPETNPVARRLQSAGRLNWPSIESDEGFAIRPVMEGDRRYLVIGGKSPHGTLSGVYYYLDRFCQVGFFLDGERIPHLTRLPMAGVRATREPYFKYRDCLSTYGASPGSGVKPFRGHYFTIEETEHVIDWLRKAGFNLTVVELSPRYYGIYWEAHPDQRDEQLWPADYRKRVYQTLFARGRLVGVNFWIASNLEAGQNDVSLWPRMLGELGLDKTPHFRLITQGAEVPDTPQAFAELQRQVEVLRQHDPMARGFYTTWEFYIHNYPADRCRRYLEQLPQDAVVWDWSSEWPPDPKVYERADYYPGHEWLYGTDCAMTPWDVLYRPMSENVANLRKMLANPGRGKLVGLTIYNEHVVGAFDTCWAFIAGRLAWDPFGSAQGGPMEGSFEDLFRDYAVRRFGPRAAPDMAEALKLLDDFNCKQRKVRGIEQGHLLQPFHRRALINPAVYACLLHVDKSHEARLASAKLAEDLTSLRESVEAALRPAAYLRGDPLYENFLVELGRTYLNEVSTHHLYRAYDAHLAGIQARLAGDRARTERARAQVKLEGDQALAVMKNLENLLAASDIGHPTSGIGHQASDIRHLTSDIGSRYRLRDMFRDITGIPGSAPPQRVKEWLVAQFADTGGYFAEENYEALALFYRPQAQKFLDLLKQRLSGPERQPFPYAEGDRDLARRLLAEVRADLLAAPWEDPSWEPPGRFTGTPSDALRAALDDL